MCLLDGHQQLAGLVGLILGRLVALHLLLIALPQPPRDHVGDEQVNEQRPVPAELEDDRLALVERFEQLLDGVPLPRRRLRVEERIPVQPVELAAQSGQRA